MHVIEDKICTLSSHWCSVHTAVATPTAAEEDCWHTWADCCWRSVAAMPHVPQFAQLLLVASLASLLTLLLVRPGSLHDTLLESDCRQPWRRDVSDQTKRRLAEETAELVQRRLSALQNPRDCRSARRLLCRVFFGCGFGCRVHHVVYCLNVAYTTQRTMLLSSAAVMYGNTSWNEIYQPLSDTCGDRSEPQRNASAAPGDPLVMEMPADNRLPPNSPFQPPAVPDLLPTIQLFHDAPHAWWVGQLVRFLTRPVPHTTKIIQGAIERRNFSTPIVGIHVRRTDKIGVEAKYHSVDHYMAAVEDIYRTLEINRGAIARKVYLATDDVSVFEEINERYPDYRVIGDEEVTRKVRTGGKYLKDEIDGILVDVHLLSICDFVVCTFSSNICRLVYEMMQSLHTDASKRVISLDDKYSFY